MVNVQIGGPVDIQMKSKKIVNNEQDKLKQGITHRGNGCPESRILDWEPYMLGKVLRHSWRHESWKIFESGIDYESIMAQSLE